MLKLKNNSKKGFTLIELAVVVSIILILAVILIPKATAQRAASKDLSVSVSNINRIDAALEGYYSASTVWASSTPATTDSNTAPNVIAACQNYDNTILNTITKGGADVVVIAEGALATTGLPNSATAITVPVAGSTPPASDTSVFGQKSIGSTVSASVGPVNGCIVIQSYATGLVIYGVDHNGKVVSPRVIQ